MKGFNFRYKHSEGLSIDKSAAKYFITSVLSWQVYSVLFVGASIERFPQSALGQLSVSLERSEVLPWQELSRVVLSTSDIIE